MLIGIAAKHVRDRILRGFLVLLPLIIAIWRGGTPVGMAVQEILAYAGIDADHIAIRTSSYAGVDRRGAVAVHGLNYVIDTYLPEKLAHPERFLP